MAELTLLDNEETLPCVIMLTRIAGGSRDQIDEGSLGAGILQQSPWFLNPTRTPQFLSRL